MIYKIISHPTLIKTYQLCTLTLCTLPFKAKNVKIKDKNRNQLPTNIQNAVNDTK